MSRLNVSAHLISVAECSTSEQNTSTLCERRVFQGWTDSWRRLLVDQSKTAFVRSTRRAKMERSSREYGRKMLTQWNKLLQKECKKHKRCPFIFLHKFQYQLRWHDVLLLCIFEAQVVWHLSHCSESLVAYRLVFTVNFTSIHEKQ